MLDILGTYDCKVDAKGRLLIPKGLSAQVKEIIHEGFVVNRDLYERSLVLYPWSVWKKNNAQLSKLNTFIKKNRDFIRQFTANAVKVELDGQGRILINASLLKYAGVKKDLKLIANGDQIEIWNPKAYEKALKADVNTEALAEEIFGNGNFDDGE
ncbi:MAG: division/cell wall cluster transcriptional repressor MraZ [Bacteroidota bacterium]